MISVDHWNATLGKRYPITVNDKGWVYGVWYCGTAWQKVKLYGQYPPGFLKRALALFPGVPEAEILHCPSGTLTGPGITVDLVRDDVRCPQVQAPCDALPFEDDRFSLVLSDPPYSPEDSAKYGCRPWPMKRFMREAARVVRPGGVLGVLDLRIPSFRRADWKLCGLICVATGCLRATRIFSLFINQKSRPPEAP